MFFKLVLKGFKLKKLVVVQKKWLNRLNRLCSFDRGPIEGCQKLSLSPSGLLFPIEVILFPIEVRFRLTVNCQEFNAND